MNPRSSLKKSTQTVAALVVLGCLTGCGTIGLAPLAPEKEEEFNACSAGCLPVEGSAHDYDAAAPAEAGSAVLLAHAQDYWLQAFAGAPEYDSGRGRVYVHNVDSVTGHLSGIVQELEAPSSAEAFGSAFLSVDLREQYTDICEDDVTPGYGDELLVGSPGHGDSSFGGKILWYLSETGWSQAGEFAPRVSAGARFGHSLAKTTSEQGPSWIAVGAPGMDAVFILQIDPCAVDPFSVHQLIFAPPIASGSDFGFSVAVADFDLDGFDDIAVGTPDLGHGRVYVYRNRSSNPGWDSSIDTLFYSAPDATLDPERGLSSVLGTIPARFGHALATGHIWTSVTRPALLIGMPDASPDFAPGLAGGVIERTGAVGQVVFREPDDDGDGIPELKPWKHQIALNPTLTPDERFGTALDSQSFAGCSEPQVAIGIPGADDNVGRVDIFLAGNDGIVFDEPYSTVLRYGAAGSLPPAEELQAQFGSALSSAFLFDSSLHEPLLVGGPLANFEGGHITLTTAEPQGVYCNGITGIWTAQDDDGYTIRISVQYVGDSTSGSLEITFIDGAMLRARDTAGDVCVMFGNDLESAIPAGTQVSIPWACGESISAEFSHTEEDITSVPIVGSVDATAELVLDFYEDGTAGLTITSAYATAVGFNFPTPADCTFFPNPVELSHESVCR